MGKRKGCVSRCVWASQQFGKACWRHFGLPLTVRSRATGMRKQNVHEIPDVRRALQRNASKHCLEWNWPYSLKITRQHFCVTVYRHTSPPKLAFHPMLIYGLGIIQTIFETWMQDIRMMHHETSFPNTEVFSTILPLQNLTYHQTLSVFVGLLKFFKHI